MIVCGLGVAGVAIASAASQCVCAALILVSLFKSREVIGLRFRALRVHGEKAKFVLRLGVPSGLQNAIFAVANLFVQVGLNSFDAVTVSGSSAAANADTLLFNMMAAFYTGCASFVSRNWGAGKTERIVKSYHPNRVLHEDHTVSAARGNTEIYEKADLEKAMAAQSAPGGQ